MSFPSDSSEDENLDLLKEATDSTFFKNSLYDGEGNTLEEEKVEKKPSLRSKDDGDDQFRLFNVTPQFQKYVGNALSVKIEKFLSENLTDVCERKRKRKKVRSCVKLLSSSKFPIDVDCDLVETSENVRKSRPKPKSNVPICESDLKSVVISGDEILSKKGTEHWSNRSKAPVYRYVENGDGVLRLIEPEFK